MKFTEIKWNINVLWSRFKYMFKTKPNYELPVPRINGGDYGEKPIVIFFPEGLFLDDERNPKDVTWINYDKNVNWKIVRTVEEFKEKLTTFNDKRLNNLPLYISFDNDLGTELEGRHAARFLVEYCLDNNVPLPTCYVHSQNPVARETIISILTCYHKAKG